MCYIETIRIEDGLPYLLALHQERMSRTCDEKGFPLPGIPCLTNLCPPELMCGMTKCRILYGKEGISDVSFSPYTP
ncbi:MAG: aminotransferase class IV, partial [Porphyromonas gingivalis]